MGDTAYRYAQAIERVARDALAQLSGLSDEALNQPASIPETNSLYALATHLAGAGAFWSVTLPAERPSNRDRTSEFIATGTFADLAARYDQWLADLHAVLDPLPDNALSRVIETPVSRDWLPANQSLTVADCVLHALEHSALHLGHIQLTVQLIQSSIWTSPRA
jgi:hypothetical protein